VRSKYESAANCFVVRLLVNSKLTNNFISGYGQDKGWAISPWTKIFNTISMEERSHGYPDITFIVHRKDRKIHFQVRLIFDRQSRRRMLISVGVYVRELDNIIALYSPPGTPNPY
jgi:hypothetical protein